MRLRNVKTGVEYEFEDPPRGSLFTIDNPEEWIRIGRDGRPIPVEAPLEEPESILDEAKRIVMGRERGYDPPEIDFERQAEMLTALFSDKLKPEAVFLPSDMARIQIVVKLCRSVTRRSRDDWVDMPGYSACGHRCEFGEW